MEKPILTNIVTKDVMQDIQRRTLEILKEAVSCSYGPHASTTAITSSMNGEAATLLKTNYSKDGVTILQSIMFQDVIELSTKDMIVDVCKNIDMKVGDGTTSAVILSTEVFKALTSTDEFKNIPPYQLVNAIKEAAERTGVRRWRVMGMDCSHLRWGKPFRYHSLYACRRGVTFL